MFASSTVIFTCLIISVAAQNNSSEEIPNPQPNPQPIPQPKYENVFSNTTSNGVQLDEIPGETDFLEYTIKLLGSAEDNTTRIPPEILKYFPAGLDQYYLSKAYEYYFANATPSNESYTGPATYMPNATYENIEFYEVKVNGFPGFKKNAQIYQSIDGSPFIKNYTINFNATADATFIIGDFKIDDEEYCFCYQALKNIYTTRVDVIRTNGGLLKPKSTTEIFAAQKEEFVHTYDSTQENYTSVNASIYSKFREAFREVYMPKLGTYVEGILKPSFTNASAKFSELYRLRLRDTLFESAHKYLSSLGNATYTFSTLNMTRDTPIPGLKAVYTYTATINGYLDFESHEFNSSQSVANGTSLLMYDVVTLHYPQHASNITVDVKDDRNVSFVETFEIRSLDIMIAYEADLSSMPVRVHPDLEKFKYLQMGFFSEFKFWHINHFYDFVTVDAQVEFAKLISNLFKSDNASSN